MPTRYRVCTEDNQAKLKSMMKQGASAQRISVALKRPLATIKQRAKDTGTPFKTDRTPS